MKNFDLPTINSRNTFNRLMFTLPSRSSYLLTGATIVMQIRSDYGTKAVANYSSDKTDGHIHIINANSFEIEPHTVLLPPDIYSYDIVIIFADGRKKTYIGGTWMIDRIISYV